MLCFRTAISRSRRTPLIARTEFESLLGTLTNIDPSYPKENLHHRVQRGHQAPEHLCPQPLACLALKDVLSDLLALAFRPQTCFRLPRSKCGLRKLRGLVGPLKSYCQKSGHSFSNHRKWLLWNSGGSIPTALGFYFCAWESF